ncbi:MAG: hypothetical protein BGO26_20510 [Actinobacteria bacterium 69-20]|jgi:uncharacterized protein (DUF885 family)|nr:DUF885 domain-containing protein [Actinomycetota bacterium]OJV24872.1 MAG: hypothetical protein BGO26_20510 [Actinobacteria bacterium 69-20]
MDTTEPAALLTALGEEYFRVRHTYDPWNATLLGLDEFDHLVNDPDPQADAEAAAALRSVQQRADDLDPRELTADQQVDRDVLISLARGAATDAEDSLWAANVSADGYVSPQGLVFQALPVMSAAGPDGTDAYLTRLAALPRMFGALAERYRSEIAGGRTPTRVGVVNAIEQLEDYLALDDAEDVLLEPARAASCETQAAAIIGGQVRPALIEFLRALSEDVAPHGRPDDRVGIDQIPGGDQAYARAVARHTTTDRTPEEIHQLGHDVLAELEAGWSAVGGRVLGIADPIEVRKALRVDPRLRYETSEQIVQGARAALDRAMATLGEYYDGPPIPPCDIVEINPVEAKHSAMAYYRPPALDGSRHGAYCVLTTLPRERFRYEYEALAFHESVPGHHLQLAACQQLDIPRYRRHLDIEACGFNEGWGLYTELLAEEIGLYSGDVDLLGRLSFTAMRACRLVVDTGMHHLGWSRQRAIDFMRANTATNEPNIVNEIDRYIVWPGQALAYMVGQREILRLREDARARLGSAFTLTQFHRRVLQYGAVPLSVLAATLGRWTADEH